MHNNQSQNQPPTLPPGFSALGDVPAQAFMPEIDDRSWIVRAYAEEYQSPGILVFDDQTVIIFLMTEETLLLMAMILRQIPEFLAECSDLYMSEHTAEIKLLRDAWWNIEAQKTRSNYAVLSAQGER